MATEPTIQSGLYYVMFAYDAARSISLDSAERRIHEATQRQTIKHKKRAPSYFEYQPPPLRVSQDVEPVNLATIGLGPVLIWWFTIVARFQSSMPCLFKGRCQTCWG